MNRFRQSALTGAAALLLLVGGFAVFNYSNLGAQVATPPAASTGSPVVGTLVGTNPTAGSVCPSYNILNINYLTGDESTCTNGLWLPNPSRLRTGVSTNTDLAGSVTLSGGAGTYTFTGTYALAPLCVATDQTAAAATKASTSTTVLTLAGTTTDVLTYVCVARN